MSYVLCIAHNLNEISVDYVKSLYEMSQQKERGWLDNVLLTSPAAELPG